MAQDVVIPMQDIMHKDNNGQVEQQHEKKHDKCIKSPIKTNSCGEEAQCVHNEKCDDLSAESSREDTHIEADSYAAQKNVAEGLMDIALLSANANQLRFLLTYNHEASTYYICLALVLISLVMQVFVGIGLLFKNRIKRFRRKRLTRTNEFLVAAVFMVTVVNILLAAFTTTDGRSGR